MRSHTFLRIVWFKKDKANTIYNLNFFLKKKFNLNRVFVIVFSYSCTYIEIIHQFLIKLLYYIKLFKLQLFIEQ